MEEIIYDCWSANGEEYFRDIESAIDRLEVGETLYQGVIAHPDIRTFINADWLIQDIQERVMDDNGEWADDYLTNITVDEVAELKELIAQYLEKKHAPDFYNATQVSERIVTEADKA